MCQGHPIPLNATPVFSLGCDSCVNPCVHSRTVLEEAILVNKNTLVCFDVAQPLLENRSLLDVGDGCEDGLQIK